MKSNIIILFFLVSLKSFLFSSHKMGADMYYTHIGGEKYKFVAKFYRDCSGIPFNSPTLTMQIGSNNSSTVCQTYSITSYNRISITDVTQICSDSSKPCSPSNTTLLGKLGVEEHVFEFEIDFSLPMYANVLNSTNCSEVTVFFEQCCRNGSITTIGNGNFLISSTLFFK